jgi:hypothetical protein
MNMSSISAGMSNDFQSALDSAGGQENKEVIQLLVQELKSAKAKVG